MLKQTPVQVLRCALDAAEHGDAAGVLVVVSGRGRATPLYVGYSDGGESIDVPAIYDAIARHTAEIEAIAVRRQ